MSVNHLRRHHRPACVGGWRGILTDCGSIGPPCDLLSCVDRDVPVSRTEAQYLRRRERQGDRIASRPLTALR